MHTYLDKQTINKNDKAKHFIKNSMDTKTYKKQNQIFKKKKIDAKKD